MFLKESRLVVWLVAILVLMAMLVCAALLSLAVGDMDIPASDILKYLRLKEGIEYAVLDNIRIPRTILAFSVGGALSLAGTLLQGVYRNPLVEPYTMGISGGAALGVAFCIVLELHLKVSYLMLPLSGFWGLCFHLSCLRLSSKQNKSLNINRML